MARRALLAWMLVSLAIACLSAATSYALEKLTLGTSYKRSADYYLVYFAAEEQGFWNQQGLEVKYIPFMGAVLQRAVAAGEVQIGISQALSQLLAASRGVPILLIAETTVRTPFSVWVVPDSPLQGPGQLKGAKIGTTALYGADHLFGLAAVRALGLEKEVKFVAVGPFPNKMAVIKARKIDGVLEGGMAMASSFLEGQVRKLLDTSDYLPREWTGAALFARKDLVEKRPDTVQRLVSAYLPALNFARTNPRWAAGKISQEDGLPEKVANYIYESVIVFSNDGRLKRKSLENVRSFLIDYGVIPKEEMLPPDRLFTDRFVK